MIPASDDLLILGAYNSIWRMTGDPLDGGQLDRVSDSIGMAFGQAWCKSPDGVIFFFGLNEPGLYVISPGGEIRNVSLNTLEETDFETIDFDLYNLKLFWNPIDRGVHIFLCPRTSSSAQPTKHWFWEEKRAGFVKHPPVWPDTFESNDHTPMGACSSGRCW